MVNPTLSLDWLLATLERRRLVSAAQVRDVQVRAPEQRARLTRQHDGGGGPAPSAPEIIASFELVDTSGALLDGDRLAQIIAAEASLPYHKIDPLQLDMELVSRSL
jgi:general secretion pathway protein E